MNLPRYILSVFNNTPNCYFFYYCFLYYTYISTSEMQRPVYDKNIGGIVTHNTDIHPVKK